MVDERVKKAEETLLKGAEVLDKLSMPYLLTGGALLGYYRDRTLIEWDSDVDVDVLIEDLPKNRNKFLKDLTRLSGVKDTFFNQQYFTINYRYINENRVTAHIPFDIFIIFKKGNKRYKHFYNESDDKKECSCLVWDAKHYDKCNWDTVKFLGRKWNVPGYLDEWIVTFFGGGWSSPQENWGWGDADNHHKFKDVEW